jgi:hypothetical protein
MVWLESRVSRGSGGLGNFELLLIVASCVYDGYFVRFIGRLVRQRFCDSFSSRCLEVVRVIGTGARP